MRFLAAISVVCLALTLCACKQQFSNKNLEVVNREFQHSDEQVAKGVRDSGVSPKEVESILGQPQRVESHKLPLETQKKEVEVVRYYYEQDGQTIELHFFDNKLISKVPLLSQKKPEPASAAAQPETSEPKP